jgi:hypothetical protein
MKLKSLIMISYKSPTFDYMWKCYFNLIVLFLIFVMNVFFDKGVN